MPKRGSKKVVLVQNGNGFFQDAWNWTRKAVPKGIKFVNQAMPVVKLVTPLIKTKYPQTKAVLESVGLGKRGRGTRLVGNGTILPHQVVRNNAVYTVKKVKR